MASLTAVTGNWHSTAASSTAFSGAATVAADEITIPNGVTVTIPSGISVVCRSLTVANGGTLIYAAATSALSIGDATAGTSNVALSIGSTATITLTGTGSMSFVSTNTTVQTITTNGKTLPNVTFNGVGGKWILQDALTCGVFTVTAGNFDTGNHDMSVSRFISSNSNVRTISLGSSLITIATDADLASTGNLTWSTNTATMRLQAMSAGSPFDYKGLSLEYPAVYSFGSSLFGAGTFKDLTVTGSAITNGFLNLNNNTVFTGTVSITGNSSVNRLLVQSNTLGTPRVITAAATSLTDVDFMDIAIVGPVGSTITSDSFNRADGALAGSTSDAADGGAGLVWSGPSQIVTNRVRMASYHSSWVDLGVTNQYVEAILSWDAGATGYWGVMLRYSASNSNIVFVVYPSINFTIGYLNGTGASFVSTNSPGAWVSGDKMGVAVVGNIYLIYRNNVLVLSGVLPSNAPTTGAGAGFSCIGNASNKEYVDNFKAYPIPNVTGTRLGDCLGNSGIEFTTASGTPRDGGGAGVKRYAVAAGNWSSTATWSESDGGAPGASVPLPQDDVYLTASSGAGTYTVNMPRACRNLDMTGFTGSTGPTSISMAIYGSITLGAGTVFTPTGGGGLNLYGRSGCTIRTNGATFAPNTGVFGEYALLDDWNGLVNRFILLIRGSFTTNNHALTLGQFTTGTGSTARVVHLGTSTFNILNATTGTEGHFYLHPTGAVTGTGTPTINIVNPYSGGDRVVGLIPSLQVAALNYTVADSPAALLLVSSGQINTLNIGSGRSLKLTSGTTQKIGTLNLNGVPRGGVRLPGVVGSYLSTPDSAAVSVTGDIDIRCRVALPDYTIASDSGLVTKYGAAGQRSFRFYFDSVGRLNFNMSTDGTANTGLQWQAGPTFVDGTTYWVRTTRTAAGTLRFFYAADQPTMPTSWTEAGLSQTLSAGQNIFDSTSPVEIGSMTLGTAYLANGVFYRAQIRNNVLDDGSGIVFDTDFSPARFWPFFLDSANGAAVTPSTTLANVGDGRVVIESSTAGTGATLEVGSVTGMNYVDLKDVVMNGADTYIGATSVIRSNVKGVRRGPKTGMSMMMGV
jgi:hypothetical protein